MNIIHQYVKNNKSKLIYLQSNSSSHPDHTWKTRYSIGRNALVNNKIKKPLSKTHVQVKNLDYDEDIDIDFDIDFDMIFCPSGYFDMGGGQDVLGKSIPTTRKHVSKPFLLGETEVTIGLYEAIMGVNPCVDKKIVSKPVNQVTWYDAVMFCNKLSQTMNLRPYYQISDVKRFDLTKKKEVIQIQEARIQIDPSSRGYRLPTSKEWEYAAKAGTSNKYAGYRRMEEAEDFAWFDENSENDLHPVKQKRPNEWGFYDMSGNVWEWCEDVVNIQNNLNPITRGGCYRSDVEFGLSITGFSHDKPKAYSSKIGFRIARYV
jgi:formylglycine-generating enzyme required for sulfatase activity